MFDYLNVFGLQANAQEKFMRIKHAYNTLMNSESRRKYDSRSHASNYTYSNAERNQSSNTQEEEFYGFGKNFCPEVHLLYILIVLMPSHVMSVYD